MLLGLSLAATAADTRIELIELKGRTAEELIPLLKPVVEPGGALTGSGFKLIVRGTDAQHREIRRLLAELDKAPRRLLITVHMGELSQREREGFGVQIDRQVGDVGVELGTAPRRDQRGLTIGHEDSDGSASLRSYSTRSLSDAGQRQQVQTLEGEPAFIAVGSARPYPSRVESWEGPRGGSGEAVEFRYQQASSGFYAVARIRGDQVVVQASPRKEAFDRRSQGTIEGQAMWTTASGPLGSWLPLGGTGTRVDEQRSGIGRSVSTQQLQAQPIWLKVDLLPDTRGAP